MGIFKKIGDLFSKKEDTKVKKEIPDESIVFNVDNFNKWFCDPNNKAIYANSGIFLRVDKLSESHIEDYLMKCYGIPNYGPFLWSQPTWEMVSDFYNEIRKDWMNKLHPQNETSL